MLKNQPNSLIYLQKVNPSCTSWHDGHHNWEHVQRLCRKQDLASVVHHMREEQSQHVLWHGCRSISSADPFHCPSGSALLFIFFLLPLLLSTTGSSPGCCCQSQCCSAGQQSPKSTERISAEAQSHRCWQERGTHFPGRVLGTALLHLLQDPSHLLGLLLLMLCKSSCVTFSFCSPTPSTHSRMLSTSRIWVLPAKACRRREGARLGWVAGTRQLGQLGQETQGSGNVCERGCGSSEPSQPRLVRATSPQPLGHWPWLAAPGISHTAEGNPGYCLEPLALPSALETHSGLALAQPSLPPACPTACGHCWMGHRGHSTVTWSV